jgi:ethanolamine permease
MSMVSLFRLRRREPGLDRPYRAPLYPIAPAVALLLSIVALAAMIYYNPLIFLLFAAMMMLAIFATVVRERRVPAFA